MDQLSETSYREYRRLIEHPAFVKFFRTVTPVADIEGLRIGSRPARRTSSIAWRTCGRSPGYSPGRSAAAWCRPGTDWARRYESILTRRRASEEAGRMYRDWPFFQATIDNAVLAVAKSNRSVFRRYVDLAGNKSGFQEIAT